MTINVIHHLGTATYCSYWTWVNGDRKNKGERGKGGTKEMGMKGK